MRIGLNLKGLDYSRHPVHLVRDGGQQHAADYVRLNPQRLVPTLVHGDHVLTQSLAILEYIEECFPDPPLLPGDAPGRARVRALALAVACDIHPLNNLRVLKFLVDEMGAGDEAKLAWYRHWVKNGLDAVEAMLAENPKTGRYCHGDNAGLADCCLLPQLYNARRFQCDESGWPEIVRICSELKRVPAVSRAAPENQSDAD